MNKTDLVKAIAKDTGESQKSVKTIVDSLFRKIESEMLEGNQVSIDEFGKFVRVLVPARTGTNPQNGDPVEIEEHYAPKFKFSSVLKRKIR